VASYATGRLSVVLRFHAASDGSHSVAIDESCLHHKVTENCCVHSSGRTRRNGSDRSLSDSEQVSPPAGRTDGRTAFDRHLTPLRRAAPSSISRTSSWALSIMPASERASCRHARRWMVIVLCHDGTRHHGRDATPSTDVQKSSNVCRTGVRMHK